MQLRIIGIANLSLIATGWHQLIAERIAAGVLAYFYASSSRQCNAFSYPLPSNRFPDHNLAGCLSLNPRQSPQPGYSSPPDCR